MKLEGGIGLSLVNKVPEELVFASLTRIHVHYTQLSTSQMLELSVQDIEVFAIFEIHLLTGHLQFFEYSRFERCL